MKKKLGPLETWQWLAIGLAAGIVFYIYRARQAAAANAASTGASPAQASDTTSLGPVDPTTGQPYALEALGTGSNNTAAQNSGPTTLAQELSDLGQIEGLLSGLANAVPTPAPGPQTPSGTAGAASVSQFTGQAAAQLTALQKTEQALTKSLGKAAKVIQAAPKATKVVVQQPTHNPGHTVTTHPGGKQSASSSAPHSSQQHSNVAPPTHQKHPTKHPSGGAGY